MTHVYMWLAQFVFINLKFNQITSLTKKKKSLNYTKIIIIIYIRDYGYLRVRDALRIIETKKKRLLMLEHETICERNVFVSMCWNLSRNWSLTQFYSEWHQNYFTFTLCIYFSKFLWNPLKHFFTIIFLPYSKVTRKKKNLN